MSARWMFNMLSPAGANARLSVLIFHRVLPAPDPLFPGEPDAVRFETQMRWIKNWFNVLPFAEAVERLRAGSLPARAAAITFDDGYADNYTVALPILRRAGLSATFFIAAGFLDGGRMWNDTVIDVIRKAEGPDLDLAQLKLGRYSVDTLEDRRRSVGELLGKLKYLEPGQRQRACRRTCWRRQDPAGARLDDDDGPASRVGRSRHDHRCPYGQPSHPVACERG